jgi:hypothetical protein
MSRPRGFAAWRPQQKTLSRLLAVQDVLDQYSDYLPLTIRQIFYRLVGTDVIGKSEKEYGNLCELLNRARRAQIVPMDAIRDDGFIGGYATRRGYMGSAEFRDEIRLIAEEYVGDRQRGQDRRIVLLCEAGGMVPQLERVAHEYGVTVKSSGGFDSTTVKHTLGEQWEQVTVLHIGDYDPSGECMFDALAEDVEAFSRFYGNDIEFLRLAVTPDQITAFNLPTAPPKHSTHQTKKRLRFTTQAEALDPADLARIVREGIEYRLDMDAYRQAVKLEQHEREQVLRIVGGAL